MVAIPLCDKIEEYIYIYIYTHIYLYIYVYTQQDFNIGGQIIQTVKYADDLVLMAKEENVLQGMIDKLIEIGICYDMEMNVEKTKSNDDFKTPIPSNNYDRAKTTGECGMF